MFRDRESDSFSSPRTHCGSKVIPKSQRRATVPACLNSQFGSWHLFRDSQELLVLQDKMTDEITLCWQPNQSAEVLTSVDAVVDRLLKITFGTTPNSGVAAMLAKPNGQQMVVIVAGHYWCLDWFPEDYNDQGCVGSYHTVSAENEISSNDIVTYCLQGHHGECLLSQTIRKEDAIQAIRSFLASSQRPDCVQWEMD